MKSVPKSNKHCAFIKACEDFKNSADSTLFCQLLDEALSDFEFSSRDLAFKFQVTPSTISKWACADVIPHPRTQQFDSEKEC